MIGKVRKQERKNPLNFIRLQRNTCIDVVILKSLPTKKARKPKTNKQTNIHTKQNKKQKQNKAKKTLKKNKNKQIKTCIEIMIFKMKQI